MSDCMYYSQSGKDCGIEFRPCTAEACDDYKKKVEDDAEMDN